MYGPLPITVIVFVPIKYLYLYLYLYFKRQIQLRVKCYSKYILECVKWYNIKNQSLLLLGFEIYPDVLLKVNNSDGSNMNVSSIVS